MASFYSTGRCYGGFQWDRGGHQQFYLDVNLWVSVMTQLARYLMGIIVA